MNTEYEKVTHREISSPPRLRGGIRYFGGKIDNDWLRGFEPINRVWFGGEAANARHREDDRVWGVRHIGYMDFPFHAVLVAWEKEE